MRIEQMGLLLLLLVVSMPSALPLVGSETGKRKLIWVGEIAPSLNYYIDMIQSDPRFEFVSTVPCNTLILPYDVALRFVRVYLPRKYGDLLSGTDGIIFHDFSPKVLTPTYLEWFRQGVEDGLGLCLVEFAQRISACGMEYWQDTSLYDAFPAELYNNCIEAIDGRQYYRIVKHGPLVDFPGMEKLIFNWGHHGDLIPKQEATTWAIWRGRKTPALVSRPYGNGTVLHYDHGWDTIPEEVKRSWRYLPDYILNHLCFITGVPFPDDLEMTHEARALFSSFDEQVRVAISVIEFIDKFGANSRQFEAKLADMKGERKRAEEAYLQGDLTKSVDVLREANQKLREIGDDMMRAKDRAMFWIFVVEWLTVSATGMVCGFLLWTLMIRRKLYREVEITRLSQV